MELEYIKYLAKGYETDAVLIDLMNAHGNDVWNFAFFLIRDADAADDICQDVFLTVYEKIHTFRGEASIKSWLLTVTRNKTYKYRRNAYFSKVVLMDFVTRKDTSRSAEAEVFDRMETKYIWNAVMKLPLRYREVLLLEVHYQLSIQEMASMLHVAEGTIKSRLHRARKKISILLQSESKGGNIL
ncbi:RNA polymerase sigma factor [Bacillus sp. FJAT-28004]|uniref:RNA polymerase sigma factor n=1 Tax=Bacillus sp. FJAT-28004 TaxID=1679165 RepID=UPI0006B5EEE7|nr:sigma-70 family RNA polymerase sigma factor [Bacillus sp. FJAT-28004]